MKINDWVCGVVEDVSDPLSLGRARIRCWDYHNQDTKVLKTEDLPWSQCLMPVSGTGQGGMGGNTSGLLPKSWVFGFFRDPGDYQDFVVIGVFPGKMNDSNPWGSGGSWGGESQAYGASATAGAYGAAATGVSNGWENSTDPTSINGTPAKFISTARSQNGVKETSKNQGPGIQKYWGATSYTQGYADRKPWCTAFVSWVIKQSGVIPSNKLPNTSSAFSYRSWAQNNPSFAQLRKNPRFIKAGDIVIFSFSHIGIATSNSQGGTVRTIEGNTNAAGARGGNGVWEKTRSLGKITDAISIKGGPDVPSGDVSSQGVTIYGGPDWDFTTFLDIKPTQRPANLISYWENDRGRNISANEANLISRGIKPGTLNLSDAYTGAYGSRLIAGKSVASTRYPGGSRLKLTNLDGTPYNPAGINPSGIYVVHDTGNQKLTYNKVDIFISRNHVSAFRSSSMGSVQVSLISKGSQAGSQYRAAQRKFA